MKAKIIVALLLAAGTGHAETNEMSRSEYERHLTTGWLFVLGMIGFVIFVIWDRFGKR